MRACNRRRNRRRPARASPLQAPFQRGETFAGALQTHLQRVMGMNYMDVQDQLWMFYAMRFGSGVAVVLGALLFIYSVMFPRREVIARGPSLAATPAE